jgi:formate dehydrogenase (coenzyme F420) beta subunit
MSSKTDTGGVPLGEGCVLCSELSNREAIIRILGSLLETGAAESIFALRSTGQKGRYCYSLISDPSLLSEVHPFHPVMPVQGARALSQLTISDPLYRPIAALLRPCEIRAMVENVKQSQGTLDNILIISCTCPGVIPAGDLISENRENVLQNHQDHIRNACRTCVEFIPGPQADMTVVLASDDPHDGTLIYLNSERALDAAEVLEGFTLRTGPALIEPATGILEDRRSAFKALIHDTPAAADGLQSLVSVFSACIGCRGCREACPLCNCILCDYETARTQHSPELVRAEAKRKGSVRVPSGTLQFQLGRLMHISPVCVACGQCSDVCPVNIPVADIFIRAASMVQKTLDYSPGRDAAEKPPMATYSEKELESITD